MGEEWGPGDSLAYNPASGLLQWKFRGREMFASDREYVRWNNRYAGCEALRCINAKGYRAGSIHHRGFLAHRVAWAIYYGSWPVGEIDHINGDKSDNRIENLREVDRVINCRNSARRLDNSTGATGVTRSGRKWLARVGTGASRIKLGLFTTFDEAVFARRTAERQMGYTERHGT